MIWGCAATFFFVFCLGEFVWFVRVVGLWFCICAKYNCVVAVCSSGGVVWWWGWAVLSGVVWCCLSWFDGVVFVLCVVCRLVWM